MSPTITVLHVDDDRDLLDLVETDPRVALGRFRDGSSYDCIVSD